MKLSVVEEELSKEIVPNVSQYNGQNKVARLAFQIIPHVVVEDFQEE